MHEFEQICLICRNGTCSLSKYYDSKCVGQAISSRCSKPLLEVGDGDTRSLGQYHLAETTQVTFPMPESIPKPSLLPGWVALGPPLQDAQRALVAPCYQCKLRGLGLSRRLCVDSISLGLRKLQLYRPEGGSGSSPAAAGYGQKGEGWELGAGWGGVRQCRVWFIESPSLRD